MLTKINVIRELCMHSKETGVNGMFKVDGDGQMDLDDLNKFLENDMHKNKDEFVNIIS